MQNLNFCRTTAQSCYEFPEHVYLCSRAKSGNSLVGATVSLLFPPLLCFPKTQTQNQWELDEETNWNSRYHSLLKLVLPNLLPRPPVSSLSRLPPFPIRVIPWRRKWQPIPVFLPRESHEQRSLVGYGPWGHKEADMTQATEQARRPCLVDSSPAAA